MKNIKLFCILVFLYSCARGSDYIADSSVDGNAGSGGSFCGDGTISDNEQCDGIELGGATCSSLGEGNGDLSCSSYCTYDFSICSGTGNSGYGS